MADNITLPGATSVVATDEIGGVNFPRTKLTLGSDGVNDGDVSAANPMPITLAALRATDSPYALGDVGVFVLGKRRDDDGISVADGDYSGINLDEAGRLKVATQPGSIAAKVQAVTANSQTVFMDVARASNVTISMVAASLVGHNVTFEYSNNSTNGTDGNWYVVQVVRSNANTVETASGVLTATPVYGWEASVNAYKWFRVRTTGHTSGTATYTILPGSYATEPIPAVQVSATQPVSGTVTANQGSTLIPTASIINSAATTNGTVVKASAGTIYGGMISNNGATAAFLKLHNSTTVTAGTTAVALTIPLPANSITPINFGPQGMRYGTGICLSITNLVVDNDTTAIAVGQVKVNLAFV